MANLSQEEFDLFRDFGLKIDGLKFMREMIDPERQMLTGVLRRLGVFEHDALEVTLHDSRGVIEVKRMIRDSEGRAQLTEDKLDVLAETVEFQLGD